MLCNKMSVTQPKAVPQEPVENCIKFNSIAPDNLQPLIINCPCPLQHDYSCLPRAAGAGLAEKPSAQAGNKSELLRGLECMERLGGSQPTPAATLLLSQGSRSLGGLESLGMNTPTPKRLLSTPWGKTPRRSQSLPFGINSMRQEKDHCLYFMHREMTDRETGRISPLLWQSWESIGISCSP